MKIVQIICVAVLIFTGCSDTKESNQRTLRVALCKEPPTIDTRKSSNIYSSVVHLLLNCGLTRVTDKNEVANDLAESISISEDGLTYIFTLKKAYWSDGSRITAKEFEKNWKTVLSPDFPAPNAQMLYCITNAKKAKEGNCSMDKVGIEALDITKLKVSLNEPTPFFLRLTASCTFFPMKHSIDKKHLSSGPFVLDKWEHNNQLLFSCNPKYHNQKKIGADKLELIVVENEETALKMFEQGELDYVGGCMCSLPLDLISQYIQDKKVNFMPLAATAELHFNTNIPPFNNLKIRKAVSLALNCNEIIQAIAPFPAKPAISLVPTMLKRAGATPPVMEGDAKTLFQEGLKEEGLENLQEINFLYTISEMNDKIGQVIQQQLRENLGLTIHLERVDFKYFLHRLERHDFMMAKGGWTAQFNDPINILTRYKYSRNETNYSNWEKNSYKKILDKSTHAKTPMERLKILEKAEQILNNESPVYPLFQWDDCYIQSPKVNDVYICSTRPPEWKEAGSD